MKVLIVTYYWPPAGGSGVQRWLKFVKYLVALGIEPVVYTPENPSYPIVDETLSSEIPDQVKVLRNKIFEPNQFLKGKKKKQSGGFLDSKPSFFGRFLQYIRANYFIPDARKYWVNPSVQFLEDKISKLNIDAVITTGPPHSLHLIGLGLKKKAGVKWIADFRDPWIYIDYFHQLPLSKSSLKKHQNLEKEVVENADHVLVVGNSMKTDFLKYNSNISVITNGFDEFISDTKVEFNTKFSLVHVGLMNSDRNPKQLWNALSELIAEEKGFQEDLEITLIGTISNEVDTELSKFPSETIKKVSYLSHNEVRKYQLSAQVLLLCINNVPFSKGIITGKIFEYLQAKRPILAIGPEDGDAAEILNHTNVGVCVDFNDKNKIKNHILTLYNQFKSGSLQVNSKNIQQYHRKELTKQLVKIIQETISIS